MEKARSTYSYGSYLMLPEKSLYSRDSGKILQQLGLPDRQSAHQTERALEKAAKKISRLNYGGCPIHEEDFRGCPVECSAEVEAWQCWMDHLKQQDGS